METALGTVLILAGLGVLAAGATDRLGFTVSAPRWRRRLSRGRALVVGPVIMAIGVLAVVNGLPG